MSDDILFRFGSWSDIADGNDVNDGIYRSYDETRDYVRAYQINLDKMYKDIAKLPLVPGSIIQSHSEEVKYSFQY